MLQSHKSGIIIDSPGSIYAWSRPSSVKAGAPVAHRLNGVFRPNFKNRSWVNTSGGRHKLWVCR